MAKREKLAMTWPILKEVRNQLNRQPESKMVEQVKRMLWSTCLVAMTGSFRISELLPTKAKSGKLLGGLDVVKELQEEGELLDSLPAAAVGA